MEELIGLLELVAVVARQTTPGVVFLGTLATGKRLPVSFAELANIATSC